MNEDGFIFTIDSVLMLIPIFIIIATIAGISLEVPHGSPYYAAQDAMDSMLLVATNPSDDSLNTIAKNITSGNIAGANDSAKSKNIKSILDSYNQNYNLTYYDNSTSSFKTLIANTTKSTSNNTLSTSTRVHYNVIFKLYMWR